MKTRLAIAMVLCLSLALFISTNASAACTSSCTNCTKFYFTTNLSYNPELDPTTSFNPALTIDQLKPFSDIRLDSVNFNGKTTHGFMFVTGANIISNPFDPNTGAIDPNTGKPREPWYVINTGRGHNTTFDPYITQGPTSGSNGATNSDLVAAYGNRNLTSINYNRERAAGELAIFEISFPYPTDTFYIWERGMDSDIHLDILDDSGNVIAHTDICRGDVSLGTGEYQFANYSIYTDTGFNWAIGSPQRCGTIGLHVNGELSKTLRFTISHPEDFGPDLKVLAAPISPASATVLLKEAGDIIKAVEIDCFKNNNRRVTLLSKLNVAIEMIMKGNYHGAAQKLDQDILKKIGTCEQPSNSDWITCCPSEADNNQIVTVANLISEAIELLE